MSVVKLSVHKNHKDRRRARALRNDVRASTRQAQEEFGHAWAGFALVVWSENGQTIASWSGSDALGATQVEDLAATAIRRQKAVMDTDAIFFRREDD